MKTTRRPTINVLQVVDVWDSIDDYIAKLADDKSTTAEARHALYCKAWEWVSLAPADRTAQWYINRIYGVVMREALLFKYGEKKPREVAWKIG